MIQLADCHLLTVIKCFRQLSSRLEFTPLVNGTGQESNGGSFRINWETFDEEIASSNRPQSTAAPALGPKKSSPEPALPERADSPQHNTLGYALPTYKKKPEEQTARRTPPPLPKPYARKSYISIIVVFNFTYLLYARGGGLITQIYLSLS
jgi:hypothetical protein